MLENERLGKKPFCEDYILEKDTRGMASHQTKQTLDYIHSDLWGPFRVASHGGARYFLSIIDNYLRKVWLYILKNKVDTFAKFKNDKF